VLGSDMTEHLNKDSNSYLTSALLITAVITTAVLSPFLATSNIGTPAAVATTTTTAAGNNATTTITQPSSEMIQLSPQPIY
jgi:hypothetical protein